MLQLNKKTETCEYVAVENSKSFHIFKSNISQNEPNDYFWCYLIKLTYGSLWITKQKIIRLSRSSGMLPLQKWTKIRASRAIALKSLDLSYGRKNLQPKSSRKFGNFLVFETKGTFKTLSNI